ncbi:class I SAM-dependent methyltransferase [Amycolatopsis cihanbeyliensis]|uniref:Methyltransferase family protein n=1 Tax=Amycolatopsis cihanbeyliensis TaxID=1128664 RepID=A0A542DFA5_AMYCI|nr:methyltransferase domain-containing protein [Amycolatopsis cihanbeyliensis]TQJ01740.1 methyltransferase family protein [Amycolatopsis cihanbeyliensis]
MSRAGDAGTSAEIKACCTAAYGSDAVALLLGESYHPGGLALTRRLAAALELGGGQRVVDVAAGSGATARLLATEYHATVDGVDLGEDTVRRARTAAEKAGLAERTRFHLGDAERIPLPDGVFNAVFCECAFCTFPDKPTAATEFARLLRPGGRVGITDVTITEAGLPEQLRTLTAWIACIADARPLEQYADILADAGLTTIRTERHDDAIAGMIDQIEARLRLLRMTAPDRLAEAGVDIEAVLRYTQPARQAVADGVIGYGLLVARKPG